MIVKLDHLDMKGPHGGGQEGRQAAQEHAEVFVGPAENNTNQNERVVARVTVSEFSQ